MPWVFAGLAECPRRHKRRRLYERESAVKQPVTKRSKPHLSSSYLG